MSAIAQPRRDVQPAAASLRARWPEWIPYATAAASLLYGLLGAFWAAGGGAFPFGVEHDPEGDKVSIFEQATPETLIWLAGALLASVAVGGALLTLGLVRPWGEIYPRWFPFLRGRPIRPRVAIAPGAAIALLIFTAGLHAIRAQLQGYYPEGSGLGEDNWGTTAPGLLWPLWGAALAAAVLAYHLRRRGPCLTCGRG